MIPQSNNQMRVQIQQLYPTYQRAQVQQLLALNHNDPKNNQIMDYNKQFWNKQKIGKVNQPTKQQIECALKKLLLIDVNGVKTDNKDVDLMDQLIVYLNSTLSKDQFVQLIIEQEIHSKVLIRLFKQTQNSSLQFLSLKVLKIVVDQLLQSKEKSLQAVQIIKVFFNQISTDYEQLSNQIIQYLKKTLNAYPSYCYNCLTSKILLKMSKLIKIQFENNIDVKSIKSKIHLSVDSNRVVNLLKICHLTLFATLYYVRDFKNIKSIVLNLIQYLLSCPINIQFAIELILLLKKYAKKRLVLDSELCFIFRHNELIVRILKRYNGQKKDILDLFIFGVSLQRAAAQNKINEDMLYCLQMMVNKEQSIMKQACWNILANITSKSCREAILLRTSLMSKIFQQLQTDNIKNKVGFSLIINEYIETTSIKRQEKRKIIANIYKSIFQLLSSSPSANEVSTVFSFIRKTMKDSAVHVQKCEQFKRMGGIPLLQGIMTVFSNNKAVRKDASDILSEINLVLNGEVSDISLNMSDN